MLPSSKTNRDSAGQAVVLELAGGPLNPIRAMDRWLARRGEADGPLVGTAQRALDIDHGMTPEEVHGVL